MNSFRDQIVFSQPAIMNGKTKIDDNNLNSITRFSSSAQSITYNFAERDIHSSTNRTMSFRKNIYNPKSKQIQGFIIWEK